MRGYDETFPIKLFYTSNIPIILQTALISNVYFFSQILHRNFKGNFFVGLLGKWQEMEIGGESRPIGGLAYYLSPPRDFGDLVKDPIHVIVYILFVLIVCGLFSRFWIEISGESP